MVRKRMSTALRVRRRLESPLLAEASGFGRRRAKFDSNILNIAFSDVLDGSLRREKMSEVEWTMTYYVQQRVLTSSALDA